MNNLVKVLPVSYYTGTGKYYVDYEVEVSGDNGYGSSYFMTQFKSFTDKKLAMEFEQKLKKELRSLNKLS